MKKIILILAIFMIAATIFLYPYNPTQPPMANETGSTTQGIQELINANNQFAIDLYHQLGDGNVLFSPYSISSALAMTYEGANGQTKEEIKNVFHFPDNLSPNFAAIYNDLNGANTVRTGNALWIQKDYPLLDTYTNKVEQYYGGKAVNLDFIGETEQSRKTINSFIEEQTNNKIKDLIPPGKVDSLTRLVLTNAIYFKGDWGYEFDKSDTKDRDFKTPTETIKAPMMHLKPEKDKFNYANLEKLKILELPYKENNMSMLILLPRQETVLDFENKREVELNYTLNDIDLNKLAEYKSQMKMSSLNGIYLPKFEFEEEYSLEKVLTDMGMPTSFSIQADFSGMTGNRDLFIGDVIHKSFVKVDEKGTEAAAATAVTMKFTSAIMNQEIFKADHPFIFIIQQNDNILFMGRVEDPR